METSPTKRRSFMPERKRKAFDREKGGKGDPKKGLRGGEKRGLQSVSKSRTEKENIREKKSVFFAESRFNEKEGKKNKAWETAASTEDHRRPG